MRAEGRAVVVDLVQHDAVSFARRFHHVEAAASGLVAAGGAGVIVDQAAERSLGAGLQPEIHHDDEAAHSPPPFTRQYSAATWSRCARITRSAASGSREAIAS